MALSRPKRAIRLVLLMGPLVAISGLVCFLSRADRSATNAPRDILEKYDEIYEGMPIYRVEELLGASGDFRSDPKIERGKEQPLIPFVAPDFSYAGKNIGLYNVSHYGMYDTLFWCWDDLAIAVSVQSSPRESVYLKGLERFDGPRPPISRAADPLRQFVYKHVDHKSYNAIWAILVFVFVVGVPTLMLCWYLTGWRSSA